MFLFTHVDFSYIKKKNPDSNSLSESQILSMSLSVAKVRKLSVTTKFSRQKLALRVDLGQESVAFTLFFCRFSLHFSKKAVTLQRVFHSIRFKVNKRLGTRRSPIFFVPKSKAC